MEGTPKRTVLASEQELWLSLLPSPGGAAAWPEAHALSLCCMKRGPSPAATGGGVGTAVWTRGEDYWMAV